MRSLKFKKVTHYANEDPECISDYYSIELFLNGEKIRHFGDWYHDRGDTKCEAFIEGVRFITGDDVMIQIEEEKIADGLT